MRVKINVTEEMYKAMFNQPIKEHIMDKPDRFTLEDDIIHQGDISDQLNLLLEDIIEESETVDVDDICNTLQGIINIHELRTKKLWDHFIQVFELDEYHPKQCCNAVKNSYNPDSKVDPFDPFKE